jgi:cystathionine beta-lyase
VAVEQFSYNPDGTFPIINATTEGVSPVGTLTPYQRVEAETIAFSEGVKSEWNAKTGVYVSGIHDGDYIKVREVDFEDLEQKLADPQTTLMILCNPHNPGGKIWDRATLSRIGELCQKYHVIVVSDEIHCDLTEPECEYVPFASVSEACRDNSVTCIAPTKAFNIAGLQTAAVSVPNPVIRHKVWRGLNTDEVAEPNAFAIDAAVAAFTKGEVWLDELRAYISENKRVATSYIQEKIPELTVILSDATYLLWVNCEEVSQNAKELVQKIREKTGLYLSDGNVFGGDGKHFFRMNLACPRERMMDGLKRLSQAITQIK